MTLILLAGCDTPFGVTSNGYLDRKPDFSCITHALSSFGQVKYNYHSYAGNSPVADYRGRNILEGHWWMYGQRCALRVEIDRVIDGWDFSNGNRGLDSPDHQAALEAQAPDIRHANELLQSNCGLPVANLTIGLPDVIHP